MQHIKKVPWWQTSSKRFPECCVGSWWWRRLKLSMLWNNGIIYIPNVHTINGLWDLLYPYVQTSTGLWDLLYPYVHPGVDLRWQTRGWIGTLSHSPGSL